MFLDDISTASAGIHRTDLRMLTRLRGGTHMTADFVYLDDDGFKIELWPETFEERLILKSLGDHLFKVVVDDSSEPALCVSDKGEVRV
jgi:hypothetical protein